MKSKVRVTFPARFFLFYKIRMCHQLYTSWVIYNSFEFLIVHYTDFPLCEFSNLLWLPGLEGPVLIEKIHTGEMSCFWCLKKNAEKTPKCCLRQKTHLQKRIQSSIRGLIPLSPRAWNCLIDPCTSFSFSRPLARQAGALPFWASPYEVHLGATWLSQCGFSRCWNVETSHPLEVVRIYCPSGSSKKIKRQPSERVLIWWNL